MKIKLVLSIVLLCITIHLFGAETSNSKMFSVGIERPATIYVGPKEAAVVYTATDLFKEDYKSVISSNLEDASSIGIADFVVGTISNRAISKWAKKAKIDISQLENCHEGFILKVISSSNGCQLAIIGSDKRGTAYGLMTVSRLMGVSPWIWWADCKPEPKTEFTLAANYELMESPSVAYRGIFINDEDWGLMPWASKNYEPKMRSLHGEDPTPHDGEIGPYTHDRIFELLLRLRANTYWPAMHGCSTPFFRVPRNQETAERYGIVLSTSHCEPMMCNINGEWKNGGIGDYNFLTNKANVANFWQQRIQKTATCDCIYTLGMRGTHDGAMQGAKTTAEQTKVLTDVIKTQRNLLKKNIKKNLTMIPQQFIPYKEVLDCYNAGLEIPEDVTLIWCDDNYGYIRHFPTLEEQARKGGNGIYYHISYWGRPHDYLWLATTPPELIQEEMLRAYNNGIKQTWILNVGDIKPAELLTTQFMEMAWNINDLDSEYELNQFVAKWYANQIGINGLLLKSMWDTYYKESFKLRPEFTGGTRTEERDPKWKQVNDVDMSESEIQARLKSLSDMVDAMNRAKKYVPERNRSAWFQLVEYPIRAMAAMNVKNLGAQLARHGKCNWSTSQAAYDTIAALTQKYNELENGKWNYIMDYQPRKLADFMPIKIEQTATKTPQNTISAIAFESDSPIGTLVPKGISKVYNLGRIHYSTDKADENELSNASYMLRVEVSLLPVHPTNGNSQRISVSTNNGFLKEINYQTKGRSEEWKQNVYYNCSKAVINIPINVNSSKETILEIKALDDDVYIQKIALH